MSKPEAFMLLAVHKIPTYSAAAQLCMVKGALEHHEKIAARPSAGTVWELLSKSAKVINMDDLKETLRAPFDSILRKQLGFEDTPPDEFNIETDALAEAVVAVLQEGTGG